MCAFCRMKITTQAFRSIAPGQRYCTKTCAVRAGAFAPPIPRVKRSGKRQPFRRVEVANAV